MRTLWHSTLSSIRRGEADWEAIAAYEPPLRRLLARKFPRTPVQLREDAVQDVLLAMREKLVLAYSAHAGAFRNFLAIAALNRMRDLLRKRQPQALDDLAAQPSPAPLDPLELEGFDLEARVLAAVRTTHERFVRGASADRALVYCLSGLLVDGLSNRELAKRELLSVDQVKRKLQTARLAIVTETLRGLLPVDTPLATLSESADLVRACLRKPRQRARQLEAATPAARDAAERLLRALLSVRQLASADPDGLIRGVDAIFTE